jgi:hypothetical protein
MFRFLSVARRPSSSPPARRARPALEHLEARDCPTNLLLTRPALAPLTGAVRPGTANFVAPPAWAAPPGAYAAPAAPSGPAAASAAGRAAPLTAPVVTSAGPGASGPSAPEGGNQAPLVTSFVGLPGVGNVWTFQGRVIDESPAGLTVRFGGIPTLQGKSATVGSDGTFCLVIQLTAPQDNGMATAQTTDWGGLNSNVAEFYVTLT